jgi:gamma-glutamyl:cysteine ligase YbdK (ATP-grasp superfamily)
VGADIQREQFTDGDRQRFLERLDEQLRALSRVLARPDFGLGEAKIGAELELCIVDRDGRPLAISEQIVRAARTPEITPEMGKFDIELSTPPVALGGEPFTTLREHMQTTVRKIRALAEQRGGRVVPISILPTLRREDFHPDAITNLPRYRALARGLAHARRGPFEISIEGEEAVHFASEDAVAMEAANTAFQLHVGTTPGEFRAMFNAAMLLSGPVLAAAANSPTFLGKRLWHETRVALFKQAGDDRPPSADGDTQLPPRVNFGNGWVRDGAHELFMESVALHSPLLPDCCEDEDALALAEAGSLPRLHELRMHHGTVWSWNRPVYDPSQGGNLRIELRALPAGPSYDDMLANGAFLIGAMFALKARMDDIVARLPFALAKRNFYCAAQHGLDAELAWPSEDGAAPKMLRADALLLELAPEARRGLLEAGAAATEVERYIGLFEQRVRSGQTGAVWQRKVLAGLARRGVVGERAMRALLERYIENFGSQRPVHLWELEGGGHV